MTYSIVIPREPTATPERTFDSLENARTGLREALGWPELWLGPGYTDRDGASETWYAYRTKRESEADPEPKDAPRIHRGRAPARD
jgi:hypothetical protein